jgi:hypothetical protein
MHAVGCGCSYKLKKMTGKHDVLRTSSFGFPTCMLWAVDDLI